MKIEHHFLTTAHDIEGLFLGTNKIATFCSRLEKQANQDIDRYSYETYVGDGFEFLVELLIKLSPTDNRIGIVDYYPVKSNMDNGVDGYGMNLLKNKCAVQVKYRTNTNSVLTSGGDKLNSFMTEAMFEGVTPELKNKSKNHYIFTTAEGLHYYTDNEKFRGSVKCIGYPQLRELLDNNIHFWNLCRKVIKTKLAAKKKARKVSL